MSISLQASYEKCNELAYSHYENFPVARMVPKGIRPHIAAIYAFARTADDIADEEHESIAEDSPIRIENLKKFESQLDIKNPELLEPQWNWIFIALKDTVEKFDIPTQLLRDLISAFSQDVVKKRYSDFTELCDYCRRSANPVGRLVLILHGFRDQKLFEMSDAICTALQLANFWQDMSVDKFKNRIYIPQSDWNGLTESEIFAEKANKKLRDVLKFQVERTAKLFDNGASLPKYLPFPLSLEIKATIAGGRAILEKIESQDFDTLSKRPSVSGLDKIKLLFKALFL